MRDPDVAYVAIANPDGEILAHSDVALIGRPLERPAGLAPAGNRAWPSTPTPAPDGGQDLRLLGPAVVQPDAPRRALPRVQRSVDRGQPAPRPQPGADRHRGHGAARRGRRGGARHRAVAADLPPGGGDEEHRGGRTSASPCPSPPGTSWAISRHSFNEMARALQEKEMIKRAFTRYVAREVVDEILKNPERLVLTGERREVTVLFCDIRGFTPAVGAPRPRGRGPAPERVLQSDDRDDLQARRHPRQVPGRRRDVRLRRAHRAGRSRHAGGADRARHAGGHRGAERPLRPRRAGRRSRSGSG